MPQTWINKIHLMLHFHFKGSKQEESTSFKWLEHGQIFLTVWALCRTWWPSLSLINMQARCQLRVRPVVKNARATAAAGFGPADADRNCWALAFSVRCLPQCIDLFLFPLDGAPQKLLVLPLLLAQLTQQPKHAKSVGYSAESVLAQRGSFVT